MRLVRGVVQHYSWGDPDAIPAMLGLEPDGRPWAELWFGTHLGGPSKVLDIGSASSNKPTLTDDTGGLFSPLVATSGELPFLLKILAAAEPLSLQSHPSLEQARAGYARENRLDIPVGNSRRIYRDPFAKPELICALGPFEALCGFREEVESVRLLHSIGGGASRIARMLTDSFSRMLWLPWQSLHDGATLRHTPLRLSVFIEAARDAIDAVIAKHAVVRELVDHVESPVGVQVDLAVCVVVQPASNSASKTEQLRFIRTRSAPLNDRKRLPSPVS